jgi:septum formation topological specificity factor MinE
VSANHKEDCAVVSPFRLAHLRYKNDASLPLEELKQDLIKFAGKFIQTESERRRMAKTITDLSVNAEKILAFISKYGETDAEKRELARSLVTICEAGYDFRSQYQLKVDELQKKVQRCRTEIARLVRAKNTKVIDEIILNHARRVWRRKPKHQNNLHATANEITSDVARDLGKRGIQTLGHDAIRKRLTKLRDGLGG